jgi:hypothetical protein
MRCRVLALVSLLGCGGGPALRNAPRPDPAVVAAGAAAIAGAATLADPDAAAKRQEVKREYDVDKPPESKPEPMPVDVLDRLDQADATRPRDGDTGGAAPAKTTAPAKDGGPAKAPRPPYLPPPPPPP